jgi:hypothetical protein
MLKRLIGPYNFNAVGFIKPIMAVFCRFKKGIKTNRLIYKNFMQTS